MKEDSLMLLSTNPKGTSSMTKKEASSKKTDTNCSTNPTSIHNHTRIVSIS